MAFDNDVAKYLPPIDVRDEDPRFAALLREVASGRKTCDQAWAEWKAIQRLDENETWQQFREEQPYADDN